MATKKKQEEDFIVFEKDRVGVTSTFKNYPDLKAIAIRKMYAFLSRCAIDSMKLKKGDEMVFAKRGDDHYIAVVPNMSSVHGYRLRSDISTKTVLTGLKLNY